METSGLQGVLDGIGGIVYCGCPDQSADCLHADRHCYLRVMNDRIIHAEGIALLISHDKKIRFQWRTENGGVRIMEAKKYRRIFTIVVDSCGIGGAKDAERFGDAGTDTLGHIAETVGNLSIPNMQKLGIANLKELKNIAPVEKPMGYFTRLSEASNGKDTMTGHWEMMGLHITKPFSVLH